MNINFNIAIKKIITIGHFENCYGKEFLAYRITDMADNEIIYFVNEQDQIVNSFNNECDYNKFIKNYHECRGENA